MQAGQRADRATPCACVHPQAPTAQKVELLHWWQLRGGEPEVVGMSRNDKGVWTCPRPAEWQNT